MTQISLDSNSFGVPPGDDHSADVRGPGAGYVTCPMVVRKFIGKTSAKVVRLTDIYRIPAAIQALSAKNVNPGNFVEDDATELKILEFIPRPARSGPY